jgi:hypothetical protein
MFNPLFYQKERFHRLNYSVYIKRGTSEIPEEALLFLFVTLDKFSFLINNLNSTDINFNQSINQVFVCLLTGQ